MLSYKRLELGRFRIPAIDPAAETVRLEGPDLAMLLDGIDVARVRRPRHWLPPGIDRMTDPPDPRIGI